MSANSHWIETKHWKVSNKNQSWAKTTCLETFWNGPWRSSWHYKQLFKTKTKQIIRKWKKEEIAQNIPCRSVIFQRPVLRTKNWLSLNLVWHPASTTSLLLSKGGILNETDWLICAKVNQNWAKIVKFQKLLNFKLNIEQPGSILSAKWQMLT